MLNISPERINHLIEESKYDAFASLKKRATSDWMIKIFSGLLFLAMIALFLPWTQNIRAKGYVTTLDPESRPQMIQALIGGRIEKWYVREGEYVRAGDTIIQISEVKEEYLDPEILERTEQQIFAKSGSASAYRDKARNLEQQNEALKKGMEVKVEQNRLKIQQTNLKIQSDSLDLIAARLKIEIAENQLVRIESLYNDGLKSLTELEAKRLAVREAQAKVIELENKLAAGRNELLSLEANREAIINDYQDKIAKSRSEIMSALSDLYNTEADVNKLQSQYNAYEQRTRNYIIKAPISGIVTKAMRSGVGEIIKNGDQIVSLMPDNYQLAVEMYVNPRDMPLLQNGQKVRVQFDGWPAIVFGGWPNNSYGTFGGEVFAIDNLISENGQYRVLVAPDPDDIAWPEAVRVGGGANTITLLNQVRLGYEIWRQLNGFPADFYRIEKANSLKPKPPLKKVK
ncbi:MAG: HlyD family efflux transporter periplasmic adaptor subunit [Saprospiraceae bacterium]|nr:HlyD family efflux transporter periplasmic adaptor subunit [Saprospiraceae bacterium]